MTQSGAAKAGLYTLTGTAVHMLVQIAGLVILARVLQPAEFGVYAVAMTVIGITTLFQDLGLSTAAVQAKELPTQVRTNLWWINASVGGGLALLTVALAPLAAWFYREPAVQTVLYVMAPTLLLAGFSAQYRASLMRSMRYGILAIIDTTAAVVGMTLSLLLAFSGGGVLALTVPQVVTGVGTLAAVVWAAKWFPGRARRGFGTRKLLRFGVAYFLTGLLTYAHRNLDVVLLGRLYSKAVVGGFNRASQITRAPLSMLSNPFARVALSTMAPVQDDHKALASLARKGQIMLNVPIAFVAGGLAAAAGPLVELALGNGWGASVPFVRLIAASEAFALMGSVAGWILTSCGRGRTLIHLSAISLATKAVLVGIGTLWGAYGIVAGVAISHVILWPFSLYWAGRVTGVRTKELLASSTMQAAIGTVSALGAWGVASMFVGWLPALAQLVVIGVLLLCFHGVAMWLCPGYRADVRFAVNGVRSALKRS